MKRGQGLEDQQMGSPKNLAEWLAAAPPIMFLLGNLGAWSVLWGLFTWLAVTHPDDRVVKALAAAGGMAGPIGMGFSLYVYALQESDGRRKSEELTTELKSQVKELSDLRSGLFDGGDSFYALLSDAKTTVERSESRSHDLDDELRKVLRGFIDGIATVDRGMSDLRDKLDALTKTDERTVRDLLRSHAGLPLTEVCARTGLSPGAALDVLRDLKATFEHGEECWKLPSVVPASEAHVWSDVVADGLDGQVPPKAAEGE